MRVDATSVCRSFLRRQSCDGREKTPSTFMSCRWKSASVERVFLRLLFIHKEFVTNPFVFAEASRNIAGVACLIFQKVAGTTEYF